MASEDKAIWTKDGQTITGAWTYCRAGDYFAIQLDAIDPVSGRPQTFRVHGDHPEFNGWKLVRPTRPRKKKSLKRT